MTDTSAKEPGFVNPLFRMAKLIGIREGFLAELLALQQNDWAFVIKAHALLESIVCQLLAAHLRHPAIESVLAEKVQMEHRIAMLKALDLVSASDRQMMRELGTIRNKLVHNVHQTDFTFPAYFTNKDSKQNFLNSFGTSWPDPIPGEPPLSRADFVVQQPRIAIWMSVMDIVSVTVHAKHRASLDSERKAAREELLRQAILGNSPPREGLDE